MIYTARARSRMCCACCNSGSKVLVARHFSGLSSSYVSSGINPISPINCLKPESPMSSKGFQPLCRHKPIMMATRTAREPGTKKLGFDDVYPSRAVVRASGFEAGFSVLQASC